MITKTISHYEILAPIGEGGMGVVYRALDTRLGRPVAVKLLRRDGAINGESRKRFVQEARAASALNHPHIITIYDIGQDQGVDFIAMEYVAGPSLAHLIGQGRLRIRDGLKYAVQIADALATAHAAGILHRDLKPANIMVSDKGSIKVLDFGLAKLTESGRLPTDRRARHDGCRSRRRAASDRGRDDPGHGGLHVARTGGGETGGCAIGRLLVRCGALRNDHRPSCLRRRDEDVHTGGDPGERARTTEPCGPRAVARISRR